MATITGHGYYCADNKTDGRPSSHRRRADRARQGSARRGSAISPRRIRGAARSRGSGRSARGPGAHARPRARPDPLRADAGLAVHVLPRRGQDHGPRPRGNAALGSDRPVLRGRPPVELRRVRIARAQARVRHQRLRRDASRTLGVGRQAPGREHDHRRARQRLRRQGPGQESCSTRSTSTARRCARSPGCPTSRSGTRTWRSSRVLQQFASQVKRAQVKRTEATLAKAHTRDSMAAFSKLTQQVNGTAEIVDQSPLIVPLRVLMPGEESGGCSIGCTS